MEISSVVHSRSLTGEGAYWDQEEHCLWWVDIPRGLINRYDPGSNLNQVWQWGEPVGCLAPRVGGGLILATRSGFHSFDPKTGERQAICDPEAHLPNNRFNDGTIDNRGRLWAGTMKDGKPAERLGRFYRFDAQHQVFAWLDDIYTTNGLAFSPDGKQMYFADSNIDVQTIWVCDYDLDDGTPSNQRVFFDCRQVRGRPDGGTVDADGCYWMAGVSGAQLVRITPTGKIDRIIDMPVERPSKPMFGGNDLKTLYVTTIGAGFEADETSLAGNLFAITGLGVQGLPQTRFAG